MHAAKDDLPIGMEIPDILTSRASAVGRPQRRRREHRHP